MASTYKVNYAIHVEPVETLADDQLGTHPVIGVRLERPWDAVARLHLRILMAQPRHRGIKMQP